MKLVLDKDGVKREIEGPFKICGSEADMKVLAKCLGLRGEKFTYGWLDIAELADSTVNTPPRKWTE